MGTFSIWHWVIVLITLFVVIFPIWRILTRTGNSGWWSLLSLIPFANLILLYGIAFGPWPIEKRNQAKVFE